MRFSFDILVICKFVKKRENKTTNCVDIYVLNIILLPSIKAELYHVNKNYVQRNITMPSCHHYNNMNICWYYISSDSLHCTASKLSTEVIAGLLVVLASEKVVVQL